MAIHGPLRPPRYQANIVPMQQRPGLGQQLGSKLLSTGVNAALSGLTGPLSSAITSGISGLFKKGGKVESKVKGYEKGGMIPSYSPGPLGMKDIVEMGKHAGGKKHLDSIKYKKTGGKISDEIEIKYQAPLAPKTPGE